MQSTAFRLHNFAVSPTFRRCICSSNVRCTLERESRFLSKMLKGSKGKKKCYYGSGAVTQSEPLTMKTFVPTHRTRRVVVLNKLFMKHITDLMSTGEVAPQLLGRGIEISNVCITTDFKLVNVYWYCKNVQEDGKTIENILGRCAGQLQHELSQLRIIGIVPPIKFIKEKYLRVVNEIEKRLNTIDFGEDFIPSTQKVPKDQPILFTQLSSETRSEIVNFNATDAVEKSKVYEVNLPEMRHDVYGLDRSLIMKKIKASVSKAKKSMQYQAPLVSANEVLEASYDIEKNLSSTERKELFEQFLKQRAMQKKRRDVSNKFDTLKESDDSYYSEDVDSVEEEDCDFETNNTK